MAERYDLVIIGGGPGGYETALFAAEKGMKTALVEERELGGTCLNRGCIPTKTLLHASSAFRKIPGLVSSGICVGEVSADMHQMRQHKDETVEKLRGGIAQLMKMKKVAVYRGRGVITGPGSVAVTGETEAELECGNILIATGSEPSLPPIPGIELPGVVTSDGILDNGERLGSLIIIGGGVIGMEFASIYSDLGTEVTVIEALDRILATIDKDAAQNLKPILKRRGVTIQTGARVAQILAGPDGKPGCRYTQKDKEFEIYADRVLVAVGRRPVTKGLFAEGFSVGTERGRILVNERYETSVPGIYAAGDVIGGIQLAHVASAEGINAVCAMLGEAPRYMMDAVPSCVYTDPEIAAVGLSQEEAEQRGIPVTVAKYVMNSNAKTILTGQERSFIKIIAREDDHKILGAVLMCTNATDMIPQFVQAIDSGLTLEDCRKVIYPHPTFVEGVKDALQ